MEVSNVFDFCYQVAEWEEWGTWTGAEFHSFPGNSLKSVQKSSIRFWGLRDAQCVKCLPCQHKDLGVWIPGIHIKTWVRQLKRVSCRLRESSYRKKYGRKQPLASTHGQEHKAYLFKRPTPSQVISSLTVAKIRGWYQREARVHEVFIHSLQTVWLLCSRHPSSLWGSEVAPPSWIQHPSSEIKVYGA